MDGGLLEDFLVARTTLSPLPGLHLTDLSVPWVPHNKQQVGGE